MFAFQCGRGMLPVNVADTKVAQRILFIILFIWACTASSSNCASGSLFASTAATGTARRVKAAGYLLEGSSLRLPERWDGGTATRGAPPFAPRATTS